ncbi:hypothetical protein ACFQBZ_11085 [Deinococcus radiophilus]
MAPPRSAVPPSPDQSGATVLLDGVSVQGGGSPQWNEVGFYVVAH